MYFKYKSPLGVRFKPLTLERDKTVLYSCKRGITIKESKNSSSVFILVLYL